MDDKKYVRVIFQLEPDRHEFLKQEAEKNGVSISQYLRNLIREKFYSSRYSSMFEEQRKERVDDGFEKDQMAMLEKIRDRFSEKPNYSYK
nr:DNA binding protein [uncultured Mediterranean phage uvMED]